MIMAQIRAEGKISPLMPGDEIMLRVIICPEGK
jgi:hypothetical protein